MAKFFREREREKEEEKKRNVELRVGVGWGEGGVVVEKMEWEMKDPACGSVLQGHVLSLGAEVFVCGAERYRFPLHVSAFIWGSAWRGQ